MAKITTNVKLKRLMDSHRLTQVKVAKLIDYSLDTVKSWCASKTSTRYRSMPNRALRSLQQELKLLVRPK
jgi:hypothetical protein